MGRRGRALIENLRSWPVSGSGDRHEDRLSPSRASLNRFDWSLSGRCEVQQQSKMTASDQRERGSSDESVGREPALM